MKGDATSWHLTVSDDRAGSFGQKALGRSVPCVGLWNSYQKFLEQVQQRSIDPTARSVDASVEYAVADTAILESIFASIKANGLRLSFRWQT